MPTEVICYPSSCSNQVPTDDGKLAATDGVANSGSCSQPTATPQECQEWSDSISARLIEIANSLPPITADFEIPKFGNDDFPAKEYLTLVDAAVISKCTQTDLLYFGSKGLIRICVGIPDGVRVESVNIGTGILNALVGWRHKMFILDPSHCEKVATTGNAESCLFKMAYSIDQYGFIRRHLPHRDFQKESGWYTTRHGKSAQIQMSVEKLFVMAFDLKEFIDAYVKRVDNNIQGPEISQPIDMPWNIAHEDDPKAAQSWYIPARYFARQLMKDNPALGKNRKKLSKMVAELLAENKIFKRGGVSPLEPITVLKSLSNVKLI